MSKEVINTLISAAYSATVSPENYDQIMDTFDDLIFTPSDLKEGEAANGGPGSKHILDPDLVLHFERAHEIYQKLGRQHAAKPHAKNLVDNAPAPALVFDNNERILVMNELARKAAAGKIGVLSDYCQNQDSLERIREFAGNTDGANILVEPGGLSAGDSNTCVLVRKIDKEEKGRLDQDPHKNEDQFFLTSIELGFDRSKTALFQRTYHLTDAETDIAVKLADGLQPQEIAQAREANLSTIRTQIKTIKKKTSCRDIPALVRLVCGFAAGLFVSAQVSSAVPAYMQTLSPLKKWGMITLRDGRKMSYLEQGDTGGTPAIFIHNMLYGAEIPDNAVEAAARQNLRILSPSRPGYGKSDKLKNAYGDTLLDGVCADMCELLDRLGIAKAMILGQTAGSAYALRFAKTYPNRTSALFAVGHAPIWRDEWMAELPKRQRLISRITLYAPRLLPLVTRTGVALIDQGHADKFIDALHKDIPVDMAALKKAGIYDHICKGLEETVAQGADGFRRDCIFPLTDYCKEAKTLKTPFHILHGDGDQVVPLSRVKDFAAAVPETTIEVVKGAGQFLLYSHWEYVLNALKRGAKPEK